MKTLLFGFIVCMVLGLAGSAQAQQTSPVPARNFRGDTLTATVNWKGFDVGPRSIDKFFQIFLDGNGTLDVAISHDGSPDTNRTLKHYHRYKNTDAPPFWGRLQGVDSVWVKTEASTIPVRWNAWD